FPWTGVQTCALPTLMKPRRPPPPGRPPPSPSPRARSCRIAVSRRPHPVAAACEDRRDLDPAAAASARFLGEEGQHVAGQGRLERDRKSGGKGNGVGG